MMLSNRNPGMDIQEDNEPASKRVYMVWSSWVSFHAEFSPKFRKYIGSSPGEQDEVARHRSQILAVEVLVFGSGNSVEVSLRNGPPLLNTLTLPCNQATTSFGSIVTGCGSEL